MDIKEHNEQAKAWLRRYADCEKRIKALGLQYKELIESQESSGAIKYSDMPKSYGGQSDLSDYIVLREKEREKYESLIKEHETIKMEIRDAINELPTGDEVLVMTMKYIDLMGWEDISKSMNLSVKHIQRSIHGRALMNIKTPEDTKDKNG